MREMVRLEWLRPEAKQKIPTSRKTGPLVGLGGRRGISSRLPVHYIIQSITAGVDKNQFIHRASDDVLSLGLGAIDFFANITGKMRWGR